MISHIIIKCVSAVLNVSLCLDDFGTNAAPMSDTGVPVALSKEII